MPSFLILAIVSFVLAAICLPIGHMIFFQIADKNQEIIVNARLVDLEATDDKNEYRIVANGETYDIKVKKKYIESILSLIENETSVTLITLHNEKKNTTRIVGVYCNDEIYLSAYRYIISRDVIAISMLGIGTIATVLAVPIPIIAFLSERYEAKHPSKRDY